MLDEQDLEELAKGVSNWNRWRLARHTLRPRLAGADLTGYTLSREFPEGQDDLLPVSTINLSPGIDFSSADLRRANLRGVRVHHGDFMKADLSQANLSSGVFYDCDFTDANLTGADLRRATLTGSRFSRSIFCETLVASATLQNSEFADVNLGGVIGLKDVKHAGPSSVGVDTLYRSAGTIPETFLAGCGLPETFLTYLPSLLSPDDVLGFYSCFISYSSTDQSFVQRLYVDLKRSKVRCWLACEDMKIGDPIRHRLDATIHAYDKLLLVLSEASLASQWVEQEVETALAKERTTKQVVLFPLRLDDAIMHATSGWPALIKNTRHIGDFSQSAGADTYQSSFLRLIRDLKAGQSLP